MAFKTKEQALEYRLQNKDKAREYNKQYRLKNKEKLNEKRKEWTKTEKGKESVKKTARKRKGYTPNGKAGLILNNMRANSKKRGHVFDDSWWSVEQICKIITGGKCAKTGLKFVIPEFDEQAYFKKHPFVASPDRIDNTKGYEPENVQWVVSIYNMMKNSFKKEDVELFIKSLKENYK
jgi:hypothetical protein